jgi:YfiR/HmsC-like
LLVILLGAGFFSARLRAQGFKEYDLKAAFLYHLAHFVEWPPEAFPEVETPLVIGVLGQDPFGKALDEIVQNEAVRNRKLVVNRFRQLDEIRVCHVLFISQSEEGRLDQILTNLKGRNILTVGDTENFARRGGIVRFLTEKNKIRLRINLDSAKAANLTVSSKLLRASEVIGSKETKP